MPTLSQALQAWLNTWAIGFSPAKPGSCWVGLSGGMDSTVLLHGLAELRGGSRAPWVLRALHLDHGLASQSPQWRAWCQQYCDSLGVPLVSARVPAGALKSGEPGLEASARTLRYQFFEGQLQNPEDALVLAHHADDQAETLLLRWLQGRGILPMPARRSLAVGQLYRPLLKLPRAELVGYAQEHDLNWIEDPSNQSEAMDRNYLRHRVLPLLQRRWPGNTAGMQRVAESVRQGEIALTQVLAERGTVPIDWCIGEAGVTVLRAWLAGRGEYEATDRALEEFVRQLQAPAERAPALQLRHGRLLRSAGQVCYETQS